MKLLINFTNKFQNRTRNTHVKSFCFLIFLTVLATVKVSGQLVVIDPEHFSPEKLFTPAYLNEHKIWKVEISIGLKKPEKPIVDLPKGQRITYDLFGNVTKLEKQGRTPQDSISEFHIYKAFQLREIIVKRKDGWQVQEIQHNSKKEVVAIQTYKLGHLKYTPPHLIKRAVNATPDFTYYFDYKETKLRKEVMKFGQYQKVYYEEIKIYSPEKLLIDYRRREDYNSFHYAFKYNEKRQCTSIETVPKNRLKKWVLLYNSKNQLSVIETYTFGNKTKLTEFFYGNNGVVKSILEVDLNNNQMLITSIKSYTL